MGRCFLPKNFISTYYSRKIAWLALIVICRLLIENRSCVPFDKPILCSMGENGLNEKRIQQVLDIEKQAQAIHAKALAEAEQLPVQAEQEAQALLDRIRAESQQEARDMIAKAQSQEEVAQVLSEAQAKIQHIESGAQSNMPRAVIYVLNRVVGRE
jgi:hypothetical protein